MLWKNTWLEATGLQFELGALHGGAGRWWQEHCCFLWVEEREDGDERWCSAFSISFIIQTQAHGMGIACTQNRSSLLTRTPLEIPAEKQLGVCLLGNFKFCQSIMKINHHLSSFFSSFCLSFPPCPSLLPFLLSSLPVLGIKSWAFHMPGKHSTADLNTFTPPSNFFKGRQFISVFLVSQAWFKYWQSNL